MKIRHALPLFLSLAAGAVDAAETDLVSINWSPEGRFVHETTLLASRFIEVCGQLAAGSRIDWAFEAAAPLNFNIHFHEGKQVRFPAKRDQVTKADGTLRAEVAQDYCWMWTNKTAADAQMKLTLKRQ
ncbi:MAG TPA: hypothetical protein VFY73_03865 [Ideonella sp.]|uniref:hypothetical protein n=1 Tax=Ideonella sp. TaxID=1929293 RepID=UPI002E368B13|nr:hypothetical protein [Ideonella sp.]HEX5683152.1 hypothetical protein [Ideonella sp.]